MLAVLVNYLCSFTFLSILNNGGESRALRPIGRHIASNKQDARQGEHVHLRVCGRVQLLFQGHLLARVFNNSEMTNSKPQLRGMIFPCKICEISNGPNRSVTLSGSSMHNNFLALQPKQHSHSSMHSVSSFNVLLQNKTKKPSLFVNTLNGRH